LSLHPQQRPTAMFKTISAPAPFNHPEADVVLRSSDKEPVDFRVFKLFLSLSSPFFSDIFTLPQPPPSLPGSPYAGETLSLSPRIRDHKIPVIQMSEDSETLQLFLGLCFPISVHPQRTTFTSLPQLQKVAEAALKFEMTSILTYLRSSSGLLSPHFLESQPLRVFAIAYRYGWDLEARQAARYTLRHSNPMSGSFVAELEFISAATFFHLQEYHRLCGEVAKSRVMLQPALAESDDCWTWITCRRCVGNSNGTSLVYSLFNRSNFPDVRKWWVQWIDEVSKEVKAKPWGETVRKWDSMNRAVERAQACSYCGPRARQDLEAYAQMLAVDIEKDVSSVSLTLQCQSDR